MSHSTILVMLLWLWSVASVGDQKDNYLKVDLAGELNRPFATENDGLIDTTGNSLDQFTGPFSSVNLAAMLDKVKPSAEDGPSRRIKWSEIHDLTTLVKSEFASELGRLSGPIVANDGQRALAMMTVVGSILESGAVVRNSDAHAWILEDFVTMESFESMWPFVTFAFRAQHLQPLIKAILSVGPKSLRAAPTVALAAQKEEYQQYVRRRGAGHSLGTIMSRHFSLSRLRAANRVNSLQKSPHLIPLLREEGEEGEETEKTEDEIDMDDARVLHACSTGSLRHFQHVYDQVGRRFKDPAKRRQALLHAIAQGHFEIVQYLLLKPSEKMHSISIIDEIFPSLGHQQYPSLYWSAWVTYEQFISPAALHEAIKRSAELGLVEATRKLLEAVSSPTVYSDALLIAVKNGHIDMVQYLFVQSTQGHSQAFSLQILRQLIMQAVSGNHLAMVKFLLQYQGLDADQRTAIDLGLDHGAVMMAACLHGNLDLIKYLVQEQATGDDRFAQVDLSEQGGNCLVQAAAAGHRDIIDYLFNEGPFHNWGVTAEVQGNELLITAAQNGRLGVIKYLLSKKDAGYRFLGVDPGAHNNQALLSAAQRHHWDIVLFLLCKDSTGQACHPSVNPFARDDELLRQLDGKNLWVVVAILQAIFDEHDTVFTCDAEAARWAIDMALKHELHDLATVLDLYHSPQGVSCCSLL